MEGWRGRKFAFLPSALFLLPCSFFLLKCLLPLALAKNLPDRGKIANLAAAMPLFFARDLPLRTEVQRAGREQSVL